MAKLKGITVTILIEEETGKDPFGSPVVSKREEKVANVLVAPASSNEIVDSQSLFGRKAVYTLAIPKGDRHNWENAKVLFFGEPWQAFGIPLEGIEELIPLDWNKKVMVTRYE